MKHNKQHYVERPCEWYPILLCVKMALYPAPMHLASDSDVSDAESIAAVDRRDRRIVMHWDFVVDVHRACLGWFYSSESVCQNNDLNVFN